MLKKLTLTFLLLAGGIAFTNAQTNVVFPRNSMWKYLDDGSDQNTAWQVPSFNDALWASGPAELGYGDGGEATVVSYGPSSSNKWQRTSFIC